MKPNCATEIFLWMKFSFWTNFHFFHLFSFTSVWLVASSWIHFDEHCFERTHTHISTRSERSLTVWWRDRCMSRWIMARGAERNRQTSIAICWRRQRWRPRRQWWLFLLLFSVFHPFRSPLLCFSFLLDVCAERARAYAYIYICELVRCVYSKYFIFTFFTCTSYCS